MTVAHEPRLSPRMQRAVDELMNLIQGRYPGATFRLTYSPESRRVIHLVTTVDVPDTDAVMDVVVDRVMELLIEEKLPIHVIPVRPHERVMEMMRHASEEQPAKPPRTTLLQPRLSQRNTLVTLITVPLASAAGVTDHRMAMRAR